MDLLGHNFKSTRSCRTDLTSHRCSTDQHQPSWSVLIYRSELHLTMASLGISLLTTETEQLFLWLGAICSPMTCWRCWSMFLSYAFFLLLVEVILPCEQRDMLSTVYILRPPNTGLFFKDSFYITF